MKCIINPFPTLQGHIDINFGLMDWLSCIVHDKSRYNEKIPNYENNFK